MRVTLVRTGVLLAAALLATTADAQVPAGGEFVVNSVTTGSQLNATTALQPDGGFVVFWSSVTASATNVMGRRFDPSGTPQGPDFQVNQWTTFSQSGPGVDAAADGSFVVAWGSEQQDGDRSGIFARRYTAGGVALGDEFQVNTYTTNRQAGPKVAAAPDGRFVVVWSSYEQDGYGWGMFGQLFDAAGQKVGGEFEVTKFTYGDQTAPSVAMAPGGEFVVAWHSPWVDGDGYGVMARRYDAFGAPLGPDFQVNSYTTHYQSGPAVAFAPDGTFVIAWSSYGQAGAATHVWTDVFARRFDTNGSPTGPEWRVNAYTTISQSFPSLAFSADGHYIVTWDSWGQDGNILGVFGRRFSSSDQPASEEFRLNQHTTGVQAGPTVRAMPDGRFLATWVSERQDGDRFGVMARRFLSDLIFEDGFETGDAGRWSASSTGGGLSVTADAALEGSLFGLQANVDGAAPLFVQDHTPEDERWYRARFTFDPSGFDPGEAARHFRSRIFLGLEDSPTRRLFAVVLKRQGGQYSLMGRARLDSGAHADTGFFALSPGAHRVEVRWARASAVGAHDGAFELWLDGTLLSSNRALDNAASALDSVRLGALSVKAGAAGTLRFDAFASRRTGPLGP